jgi:hypothetical protein
MPESGLIIVQHHSGRGWEVVHELSRLPLGFTVRLRRHATAAASDLYRTGVDFTLPVAQMKAGPRWPKAGRVSARWKQMTVTCCHGGEHYSPMTYALDGRCTGPMSNGKPRRS